MSESGTPLITAAMPSELRHAIEASRVRSTMAYGPWTMYEADLDGAPVRLLLSGIGMVNAGAALARALADDVPRFVLNFGCAGAHQMDIHAGDVVIGRRYVHPRAVTILPDGVEQYTGMPISPAEVGKVALSIDASPALLRAALEVATDWRPEPWPGDSHRVPDVHVGSVASADAWTQAPSIIERLNRDHESLCEDMEAAALAQISLMHGVPFLAVKDISNNELHSSTEHGDVGPTLDAVLEEVGRRAFELVRRVLAAVS